MTLSKLILRLAALPLLCFAGCSTMHTVSVHSRPSGARILLGDKDTGLTTPASLSLSTENESYAITLEKAGYNKVSREVRLSRDVEVMSPEEAAGRVLCAPCCLGLTLPGCLTPIDVNSGFSPGRIDATLDVAGQGLRVDVDPADAEIYANGRLTRPLDGAYLILDPGDHEIEIRAPGFRTYVRVIRVTPLIYQDFQVVLEIEGQGLLLESSPKRAKVFVNDQYQGALENGPRRFRLEPGAHSLRLELDGYQTFDDVVTIAPDEYRTMSVNLTMAGQGIVFQKPKGLRKNQRNVQILVNGAVHSTSFDEPLRLEMGTHSVEVEVPGFETWSLVVEVQEDHFLVLEPVLKRQSRQQ